MLDNWKSGLRLLGIGFYICACIIGGALGGMWLDNIFNTEPFLILAGLIIGIVVAFWGVFQMLVPIIKDYNKKRKGDNQ